MSSTVKREKRNSSNTARQLVATLIVVMIATQTVVAQELEYKYEFGALAGTGFYLGDANYSALYKNSHLAGGLFGRYNINPRMALKADLAYSGISGNALELKNRFPDVEGQEWEFSNSVVDLSCQYEICFWGYGTGRGYKGSRRLAPYIQLGLGFTYGNKKLTMNFPIGFGVRYKLADRVNVGLDWTMHFAFADHLDGIEDPYSIKSGMLKNKDSYGLTLLYISYDFCPKYRKCNND